MTTARVHHPDRNLGKESDVVSKFQAVQAAHEILSDPIQKRKYDAERARLKAKTATGAAATAANAAGSPPPPRRGPVPPTPSQFPPPPRRTAPTAARQDPFSASANASRARPTSSADKYAPFSRAGEHSWDKSKDESRSKADAFRGFQQMRPGHSPTRERFAPTPPPRPNNYTSSSSRPASYMPHTAGAVPESFPRHRKSWDDFEKAGRRSSGNEPSGGGPGLSRSQTTARRKQGFTPMDPIGDEPQAPRSSAYAAYAQGKRPQASTPQSYFPENPPQPRQPSPPQQEPRRSGVSPLRHSRSSPGAEDDGRQPRPNLERISTRYSSIGGERTNLTSGPSGKPASAQNSPFDQRRFEYGRDGSFAAQGQERRRQAPSESPKSRPTPMPQVDSESSSSDIDTEDDDPQAKWPGRLKATPRLSRPTPTSSQFEARKAMNGRASSEQFPGANYVRPSISANSEAARQQQRPPSSSSSRRPSQNQNPSQASYNYVPSFSRARYTPQQGMPGAEDSAPNSNHAPSRGSEKYVPLPTALRIPSDSRDRLGPIDCASLKKFEPSCGRSSCSYPRWAEPSSLLSFNLLPQKHTLTTADGEESPLRQAQQPEVPIVSGCSLYQSSERGEFANSAWCASSKSETNSRDVRSAFQPQQPQPPPSSSTQPPTFPPPPSDPMSRKFSASEWNERFAGAEDMFRPNLSESQGKRSPVRTMSPRTTSHHRAQTVSSTKPQTFAERAGDGSSRPIGNDSTSTGPFAPGKFSAEQWAEKLKFQGASKEGPNRDTSSASAASESPFTTSSGIKTTTIEVEVGSATDSDGSESTNRFSDAPDPMDVDEPAPRRTSAASVGGRTSTSRPSGAARLTAEDAGRRFSASNIHRSSSRSPRRERRAGLSMDDLVNVAPMKPSNSGLGDLNDLNTTLPFESRASASRPSTPRNANTQSNANANANANVNTVPFSSIKALNLPKPPKEVVPPLEQLDQDSWSRYVTAISAYMREWHVFNQKMLAHFQARDAEITMTLTRNWVSALGDGPSGKDVCRKLQEGGVSVGGEGGDGGSGSGGQNGGINGGTAAGVSSGSGGVGSYSATAGYAAYRDWMEEDLRVREWWNLACERHREAVIQLGLVRQKARGMNGST